MIIVCRRFPPLMKKLPLALAVLLLLAAAAHFFGLPARVARWVRLFDSILQQGAEWIGTVLPITISGTRSNPRLGFEVPS